MANPQEFIDSLEADYASMQNLLEASRRTIDAAIRFNEPERVCRGCGYIMPRGTDIVHCQPAPDETYKDRVAKIIGTFPGAT